MLTAENQHLDRKSLRTVQDKTADWSALACDCVCFANGSGGCILVGIEDGESMPPVSQQISIDLLEKIRKRMSELTVNVQVLASIKQAENGGQFVELNINRSNAVASTTDGRYYLRVADTCVPVVGDDVMRLSNERPGRPWEDTDSAVPFNAADPKQVSGFIQGIRQSDRCKHVVKEKSGHELLEHYGLIEGKTLTRLGVLLVGSTADRRALGTAPIVQAIKYDEQEKKVNKWTWDDHTLSPMDLIDEVWRTIPDFRESYEVADGLFRRNVPAYDEAVVRELLVNALVHRPYTQQGDVFLNLYPDRLEIVNPGRLPLGVTPKNILHASRRRNEGLARIFHDLGLMEREGTGIDLVYDRLLSQGRPRPLLEEGPDRVVVTIRRQILNPSVMRLITEADERFQLSQRERIMLGVLCQSDGLRIGELTEILETSTDALTSWFGRLMDLQLVQSKGRTKGTIYFVKPDLLRGAGLDHVTSLKGIESHRLKELIREDLRRYPKSKIGDIEKRIGQEIGRSQLKRAIKQLVESDVVIMEGVRAGARYLLNDAE